jgi:hypothetical protein
LIKSERCGILARGAWDPAEHPRAGVPPNPGWFSPTGASGAAGSTEVAQSEEEERVPEEVLDPPAPLRQAQWHAAIATLREIDPNNPNLTYFANPDTAASQAALDRLESAVETAAIKRVTDKVMPGGVPIGKPDTNARIRELSGGAKAAEEMFEYLRVGGRTVEAPDLEGIVVKLPAGAGYITFRTTSRSGSPAVDSQCFGNPVQAHAFQLEAPMNMKELVEDFMKESDVDYVGLWEIAQTAREDLHAESTEETRLLSLQIVRQLYEEGLRPGDYNLGTRFNYWPDEGCQAMLDRIEREWIAAGADPNLAEPICYFAPSMG